MSKWRCGVCGYIHEGEQPPAKCPVCGADGSVFELIGEEGAAAAATTETKPAEAAAEKKWRCTVCGYIHVGDEPPDICPVCGSGKDAFEEVIEAADTSSKAPRETPVTGPATVPGKTPGQGDFDQAPTSFITRMQQGIIHQVMKHHIHPVSVHIPNGVLPISVLFILLAMLSGHSALQTAAMYNMVLVVITLPLVLLTGYIEWKNRYAGALTGRFKMKITAALVVACSATIIVLWWIINPDVLQSSFAVKGAFVLLNLLMLLAAIIAGLIGGKLVFRD